jgi:DNA-binding LytR/AlgR family response regulator
MEIEIKLDSGATVPKVIIITDKVDKEIEELVEKISKYKPAVICGSKDDIIRILEPGEISRIYSEGRKIAAITDDGEYIIRRRLFEVEEALELSKFARISNSEIINLSKVKHFDLSFRGTICVKMNDGSVTYVSRRYVSKIKSILGV